MPTKPEYIPNYLVTKHYGSMAHICSGTPSSQADARRVAGAQARSKGEFRGKAYVRVWKLVKELEVIDAD